MVSVQQLLIIFAVALGRFVLGWMWYGILFGTQWQEAMKESGKEVSKDSTQGMFQGLTFNFFAALATSFVMCHLTNQLGITTMIAGALLGVMCWLGFVIPPQIDALMFEKQHKSLFLINTVYHLTALILMGVFYGLWY